jgi:hypothetical protein
MDTTTLIMDKFLLAKNPRRPESSGLWVIHLLEPKAMIECQEGHVNSDDLFQHYQFQNSKGETEEWTLSVYHFFTTDFLTEPNQQAEKLLNKAWRWFRSYLEWKIIKKPPQLD